MNTIERHPGRRWTSFARTLAILALPAALLAGCSDSEDGPPNTPVPTVTATGAVPTSTATTARTSTPTAIVPTATVPAPTATRTAPPTSTPTTAPNTDAMAACTKLVSCKQCMIDSTGQCIPNESCAQRLNDDSAICINNVAGCDGTTLGDCLFFGCDGSDASGECQ